MSSAKAGEPAIHALRCRRRQRRGWPALWIVADRAYSSHAFRLLIGSLGARPAIPTRRNEAPVACPPWIYTNRNLVERFWSRVKGRAAKRTDRAVATRYEKTERSFMGVLCMAATMDWLKA